MFDIIERIKELRAKGLETIQVYEMLILELEREQTQRRLKRLLLENNAHKARTYFMN